MLGAGSKLGAWPGIPTLCFEINETMFDAPRFRVDIVRLASLLGQSPLAPQIENNDIPPTHSAFPHLPTPDAFFEHIMSEECKTPKTLEVIGI